MSNRLLIFLALVLFTSCAEEVKWSQVPPKEYIGVFYQVNDEIIQGIDVPIIFNIEAKSVHYSDAFNKRTLPIQRVSLTNNKIIIFCGVPNDNYIADTRYEIYWRDDNYLQINEIVTTGHNNDDAVLKLGKFTKNKNFNN